MLMILLLGLVLAVVLSAQARRTATQVLREPVGTLIPLGLAVAVVAVPQMPDMLAGTRVGVDEAGVAEEAFWRGLGVPVLAGLLGLSGWFWTRAALMAPLRGDDWRRWRAPPEERILPVAASRQAQRLPFAAAGLVVAAPLLALPDERWQEPALLVALGGLANLLLWRAIRNEALRTRLAPGRSPPNWAWRTRTGSVIAAAPFGPWVGLGVLAASLGLYGVLLAAPGLVEMRLHTPDAALLAAALLIGPLTLTLALLRDLIGLLLWLPARWMPAVGGWAEPLGVLALLGLMFVAGDWQAPRERYLIDRLAMPLHEPVTADGRCQPGGVLPPGSLRRPCLEEALTAWVAARRGAVPDGTPLPLIIVAAQGGASRSAVWTLSVMRQLDVATAGRFGEHVFAISAVSGGALGAVSYMQAALAHGRGNGSVDWSHPRVQGMLEQLSQADLLAASFATYVLHDTLVAAWRRLHPDGRTDRGRILEGAFERHWSWKAGLGLPLPEAQAGLVARHQSVPPGRLPHLVLNGTDRTTGRRVLTATLRFEPGDEIFPQADDLLGLLDGAEANCTLRIRDGVSHGLDIGAATAVHNAARFPFVSPAGLLNPPCHDPTTGRLAGRRQLLDGGYFENYGAETAADLVHAIRRIAQERRLAIRPLVVVISNNADSWADEAAWREYRRRLGLPEQEQERGPLLEETTTTCPENPAVGAPSSRAGMPVAEASRPPSSQALMNPGRGQPGGPGLATVAPVAEAVRRRLGLADEPGAATQLLAPFLGLAAVRGAQGEQALQRLRRDLCSEHASPGLFHIALPSPLPEGGDFGGYAAPMNWVLNPSASRFMVEDRPTGRPLSAPGRMSPGFDNAYNRGQAEGVRAALSQAAASAVR